jgi:cytochrome c556
MAVLLAGCAVPAAQTQEGSVKSLMLDRIIPASTQVFTAAGDPPASAEQWAAVGQAAEELGDAARMLRRPKIYPTGSEWARQANALIDASLRLELAARERQEAMLAAAGDAAYASCEGCHQNYLKAPDRAP